jgi:predicted MFS family arabinose efflux permease
MRTLLLPIAIGGCSIGATQVALAAIGSELHIPGSAGVLLALWCVGSLLGGLWYGGRAWSSAAQERYSALLVMMAASAAPLLVVRSMPGQYPLALLAGVAVAPMIAAQNALVAFLAPAYAITEAFTWSTAAIYAGIAGGEVAAGWLVDRAGPHAAVTISCVSACLAALVAVALRERLTRPARS